MKGRNKGITLIALTITITVILILAYIVTYAGVGIIRQAKLNKFTTEMNIMQTEVNKLYDRYTNGEDVLNIGRGLDAQADKVFKKEASGLTNKVGYRYYDTETIKNLGIKGISGEFFVNIEKRNVVSYSGFEYEGVTYYTLNQLPNGLYNVDSSDKNIENPTFETSVEETEENNWRITISNIQYNGYVDKWQVKYKKVGDGYWTTSEDLSFIVSEKGLYKIFIQNGDILSDIKDLNVGMEVATVTAEITSTDYNDTDRQIVEKVTQVSTGVEIDYSKCKWVYNTESEEIGTDESKYTGGRFSSQEEEITLQINEPGIHYLHILTVDVNGEKMETIVRPIVVRINSIYSGEIAAPGRKVSVETEKEEAVTLSDGTEIATTGNDGKVYLLFNKIDGVGRYNIVTKNAMSNAEQSDTGYKTKIDLTDNTVSIPLNEENYYSGNVDEYGLFNITIIVRE